MRDSNELTRKKSLLWQFHMHTLQNNLDITLKAIVSNDLQALSNSQESLTAQLGEEEERNAGMMSEIAALEQDHSDKLAAFEEVKRLTDALIKDSKKFEKEEVGLSEKKKHLTTKQKKFKKSIAEVSWLAGWPELAKPRMVMLDPKHWLPSKTMLPSWRLIETRSPTWKRSL